jgi:hypothetical protein
MEFWISALRPVMPRPISAFSMAVCAAVPLVISTMEMPTRAGSVWPPVIEHSGVAVGTPEGHLLVDARVLSIDRVVDVWVLDGALLESTPDSETGFSLFRQISTEPIDNPNAVLATLRPNMLIDEGLARCPGIAGLPVKAAKGLGSLVGTQLNGQPSLEDVATEVLLTGSTGQGMIAVGFDGPAVAGNLALGSNLVCVTVEVFLLSQSA